MNQETLTAAEIDRLAHKRAGAHMGLLVHATVYVLVNLLLWGIALASGRHWAIFPTLGWSLGLAIHAAALRRRLAIHPIEHHRKSQHPPRR